MKPIYSKRRLKKLGIDVRHRKDGILVNINSNGGNAKQYSQICNMLKESKKKIEARVTGYNTSSAELILFHNILNKICSKVPQFNTRSQYGNYSGNIDG